MEKDPESGRFGRITHFQRVFHQGVLDNDIIEHSYNGSGTETDPFLVTWIDNDPVNPMNYSVSLKWSITVLVAVATLAVTFVSSAYSGGIVQILQEFRVAQIIGTLGISLFVLGFAIGPLLWAPLSGEYPMIVTTKVQSLTPDRAVWSPVPFLRYLHVAYYLQCGCSWLAEYRNSHHPEVPGWCVWVLTPDQRWWCHCGHVLSISARPRHKCLRRSPFPGTCYRTNW